MPNASADQCKKRGNDAFAKGKLEAAIEAYSEAICFEPSEPVYYTNRAMCHRRKEDWDAVISDCNTAVSLDGTSIKGHYLLGVALDAHTAAYEEAASHLFRALELCKERTVSYKEDIQRAMLATRRRQWQAALPASDFQLGQTRSMVTGLLSAHDQQLRASGAGAGETAHVAQVEACFGEALDALQRQRGPGTVPEHFCCQITMEPMLDPVTTPDGITYERSALKEHLSKVGKFDPVTRRALEPHQLVPNLALKEAIGAYLQANPWAYESPLC